MIDDDREVPAIHLVEAGLVHVQPFQCFARGSPIELAVGQDLREVARASQQAIGDARRAA